MKGACPCGAWGGDWWMDGTYPCDVWGGDWWMEGTYPCSMCKGGLVDGACLSMWMLGKGLWIEGAFPVVFGGELVVRGCLFIWCVGGVVVDGRRLCM